MNQLKRITFDPAVTGGKPCIRGMRVTVGMIVGLFAAGRTEQEILKAYPYLEDIRALLRANRAVLDMEAVRAYFRLFERETLLDELLRETG